MKLRHNPIILILIIISFLNVYSKEGPYPQFMFSDADMKVYTTKVNSIRAKYRLHPFKFKKDAVNATNIRVKTIYKKIEHKTYEEVRDSAQQWMHYGMTNDLDAYNVSLDLDKKGYSMISPGEIVAGYFCVNKEMVRDELFDELLDGWLNSPPHRVQLLSEYDDSFGISFAYCGPKKGVMTCMVIFKEFIKKKKKGKR